MTFEISTTSSEATQSLAHKLGGLVKGGDVIELVSDLGGGKTTFTQGLARGLGYSGHVTSPTFALSQIYKLKAPLELHHYDLYRLGETGAVGDELAEDMADPHVITVIEWADIAKNDLPGDRLRIIFHVTTETGRSLIFSSGGPRSDQLIEGLKS